MGRYFCILVTFVVALNETEFIELDLDRRVGETDWNFTQGLHFNTLWMRLLNVGLPGNIVSLECYGDCDSGRPWA